MGKVLSLVWTRCLPAWGAGVWLTVERELWVGQEGLQSCTWPDLVMHAPCDLWCNTGCFSLKAICFPPTYCVSPQKSLPWKKMPSHQPGKSGFLSPLSLDLLTSFHSQKHICSRPTESTSEISALASLELGISREPEEGNESRRWSREVWKEMQGKNETHVWSQATGWVCEGKNRTYRKEFWTQGN